MLSASRIKWIGFLLLLMMAVRVSITPGIQHQHQHGERPHTHSHPHLHGTHSHSHEESLPELVTADGETGIDHSHIHISVFGWELTLSSFANAETANGRVETASPASAPHSPEAMPLPAGECVTSASCGGTLIQFLFELRSSAPPARLELPHGSLSRSLHNRGPGYASRDRERPLLPPPKPVSLLQSAC